MNKTTIITGIPKTAAYTKPTPGKLACQAYTSKTGLAIVADVNKKTRWGRRGDEEAWEIAASAGRQELLTKINQLGKQVYVLRKILVRLIGFILSRQTLGFDQWVEASIKEAGMTQTEDNQLVAGPYMQHSEDSKLGKEEIARIVGSEIL